MNDKVLHLMRHGTTEMNVYLSKHRYGSPGFHDPLLYDTRLTPRGQLGALNAVEQVRKLQPKPQLLVVSPLSRALHTATLAFGAEFACPTLVEPLWRERLYLSSDVGSHPSALTKAFPHFSFDHLPGIWWYSQDPNDPLAVYEEPNDAFNSRMLQLHDWIRARPEKSIAVVSHWGCLYALTGHNFDNCELRTVRVKDLQPVLQVPV